MLKRNMVTHLLIKMYWLLFYDLWEIDFPQIKEKCICEICGRYVFCKTGCDVR